MITKLQRFHFAVIYSLAVGVLAGLPDFCLADKEISNADASNPGNTQDTLVGNWLATTAEDGLLVLAIRPDGTLSYDFSEGDEDEGEGSYELRSGMILFREPGKSKVVAWTYHFDRKGLLYLHMEDSAEVYVFVRQTNTR